MSSKKAPQKGNVNAEVPLHEIIGLEFRKICEKYNTPGVAVTFANSNLQVHRCNIGAGNIFIAAEILRKDGFKVLTGEL